MLAWQIFLEYESPEYSEEGTEEFRRCLKDEKYVKGIAYYGAFGEKRLLALSVFGRKISISVFLCSRGTTTDEASEQGYLDA